MKSKRKYGCLLAIVAFLALAWTAFVWSPFYQYYQHMFVTERISFTIPDFGEEILHSRIGIHPMMAEYNRWIAVTKNGERMPTQELSIDTCGGYPINCYVLEAIDTTFLRLDDAVSEHFVDLRSGEVHAVHRIDGVKYYGPVSNGSETTVWKVDGFTGAISIRGEPAKLLSDITSDITGKYIGQLDGKVGRLNFFSTTERKEAKIRHQFE